MSLFFPIFNDFSLFNNEFFQNPETMGWKDVGDAFEVRIPNRGMSLRDLVLEVRGNTLIIKGGYKVETRTVKSTQNFCEEHTFPEGSDPSTVSATTMTPSKDFKIRVAKAVQNMSSKRRKITVS